MLKWSNLEFTFEVGGSLVASDAMFLEPCHAVIHAKILTGMNRENFAVTCEELIDPEKRSQES